MGNLPVSVIGGPSTHEKCTGLVRNASKKDLVPIVVELKTQVLFSILPKKKKKKKKSCPVKVSEQTNVWVRSIGLIR